MARYKIRTNWNIAVILSLLSSVSNAIASSAGCNDTGITINMHNATSSGNLSSPNHPDWIQGNSSCIWILTCPPERLIKMYFNDIIFNNFSKNHSYLEIRDGVKASSPLIINVTAGESKLKENNSVIYSSGQSLSLYLKKGLGEATGSMRFHISYSYIKPGKSCTTNNSEDENNNILFTTGSPFLLTIGADSLPSEVDCTWKITPSIMGVLMNITLNIKNTLFCRTGNVLVFDGPYGPVSKMKHNLCQDLRGGTSFTSDVGLSIQLKSSNFSSILQIQGNEDDCIKRNSKYMTKNSISIGQPLSRTRCQRVISIPSGALLLKIFYLYLPHGCKNNSVQIFELHKYSNKSTLRAKFCETPLLFGRPDIVISSGQVLIKVQTEASSDHLHGFQSYFYPAGALTDFSFCTLFNNPKRNANIIRTDRDGYFGSPLSASGSYTYPYPPGMLCRWMILPTNVTDKEQIKFRFAHFGFSKGYDKDCAQDHVQFDFGNGRVQRYCKATKNPSVIYSGDAKTVNVTFVSTPLYTGNYGFWINYKVVPIVPQPSPRQLLSWTVIGVLIGVGCLLVACIAFGIYRWKRKRQHDRVMQRMTNERDEQEETLQEEEAMVSLTPQGPPPPYTSKDEESQAMQQRSDQPYPWFSPGTTIMEHSPRERRPEPEMESKT